MAPSPSESDVQTAQPPAEARWSRNAIASLVALFLCVPLAPVFALSAFSECARTPGMKGRRLAFVVLLLSLGFLTIAAYGFVQGLSGAYDGNG